MIFTDYFGIDIVEGCWLVVAQQRQGRSVCHRCFKNSAGGLTALVKFIQAHATKPKVCIKAVGEAALSVALRLGRLPEAEVILLPSHRLSPTASQGSPPLAPLPVTDQAPSPAMLLARCAEIMI
ncbi:MAG TPA: hypothetical protein VES89_01715 [Candidatus Competibacteraceae bacterium]|nr:hypothetical protein [Candidatus Competibacteraceae bacterium]